MLELEPETNLPAPRRAQEPAVSVVAGGRFARVPWRRGACGWRSRHEGAVSRLATSFGSAARALAPEVAVGGGDHVHVHVAAERPAHRAPPRAPGARAAASPGRARGLAHLVEKERPAVSHLEEAALVAIRAGGAAPLATSGAGSSWSCSPAGPPGASCAPVRARPKSARVWVEMHTASTAQPRPRTPSRPVATA